MSVSWRIVQGDCREVLASLDTGSVQCCVTSPPYLGLRDYGLPATRWPAIDYRTLGGEVRVPAMECVLGLEPSVEAWVGHLVQVFREVRRVLRDDGTLWLNLGDAYAGSWGAQSRDAQVGPEAARSLSATQIATHPKRARTGSVPADASYKPKDLLGLPWMVAFALRADGWWLREEVIWSKRTPMPESVRDRCTRSHEQLFRLTKSRRYFADMDAIREPLAAKTHPFGTTRERNGAGEHVKSDNWARAVPERAPRLNGDGEPAGANKRSVWTVSSAPFPAAHFATFPAKLVEPAILCATSLTACGECGAPWRRVVDVARDQPDEPKRALTDAAYRDPRAAQSINTTGAHGSGTRARSTLGFEPTCGHHDDTGRCTVLDPFAGAATTGLVALRHDRSFVGIELNAEYVELGRARILADQPLLNQATEAAG